MALALTTSPAQAPQDWVSSPTAIARRREIARSGSVGSERASDSPAAVTAPPAAGPPARQARRSAAGGRRTSRASAAASITLRVSISASWGRA